MILAYDGTGFKGSQRQAKGRTVQGEVETALRSLGWAGQSILMAGRTDTGVHATGQAAAFDLDWQHTDQDLCQALNAALPPDVSARSVQQACPGFHPRFSALARRYRYRIFCDQVRNPLRERFAWRVWPAVDPDRLRAAALLLPGRWDFSPFGAPVSANGGTIRTVRSASWLTAAEGLEFAITADAFLYHMVRRLVYIQVLVGQGRVETDTIRAALATGRPVPPGLAPAHGLALEYIEYGNLQESHTMNTAGGMRYRPPAAIGEDDRG